MNVKIHVKHASINLIKQIKGRICFWGPTQVVKGWIGVRGGVPGSYPIGDKKWKKKIISLPIKKKDLIFLIYSCLYL